MHRDDSRLDFSAHVKAGAMPTDSLVLRRANSLRRNHLCRSGREKSRMRCPLWSTPKTAKRPPVSTFDTGGRAPGLLEYIGDVLTLPAFSPRQTTEEAAALQSRICLHRTSPARSSGSRW